MRDLIYYSSLRDFNSNVDNGIINSLIIDKLRLKGIGVNTPQINTFTESLNRVSNLLSEGKINQDFFCAIEYVIFASHKKRIDFMISGYDEKGESNLIIFELKRWSNDAVFNIENSMNLKALVSRDNFQEVSHPSEQAKEYKELFESNYLVVEKTPIKINAVSWLHNYDDTTTDNVIKEPKYNSLLLEYPTFLKTDNSKLRSFINRYLKKPDSGKIFELLDNSEIKPTQHLKDNVCDHILNNKKYSLFYSQKIVYNAVLAKLTECLKNNKKTTFVIRGGPGTGKSFVALNLLGEIICNKNGKCFYITQNSSVRNLLNSSLNNSTLNNLLAWSGDWVRMRREDNELDCVLVDEAHRIQTSAQGATVKNTSIINEIIKSSKVSVFFIDENQFVTHNDSGTIENIKQFAKNNNSEFIMKPEFNLETQFRCNGSDGYIAYLEYILRDKKPEDVPYKFNYELKFFDNKDTFYNAVLRKKMDGHFARFLAGYCYEWDKNDLNKKVVTPLQLPWNRDTKTWASRVDSFNEVGCVFSSQGVEFDYVGVIIGRDLIFKNNKIEVEVENHAKSDQTYMNKNFKRTDKNIEKAKKFIINAYYILLTRGIKGCYIYCEDKNLKTYLEKVYDDFKNNRIRSY